MLEAPQAELEAKGERTDVGKRCPTTKVEEAEDYLTGTVECSGEVYLKFTGYPFRVAEGGGVCIDLHWHNAGEFGEHICEIVRRATFEAAKAIHQIGEDLGLDFEKISPYELLPAALQKEQSQVTKASKDVPPPEFKKTQKDHGISMWTIWIIFGIGCLVGMLLK